MRQCQLPYLFAAASFAAMLESAEQLTAVPRRVGQHSLFQYRHSSPLPNASVLHTNLILRGGKGKKGCETPQKDLSVEVSVRRSQLAREHREDTANQSEPGGQQGSWGIDEDEDYGFYKLLGLSRDATQEQIRKAYRSLAIAAHPDRNRKDPDATAKFQTLQKVYEVLSSPESRQRYDDCGGRADEGGLEDVFDGRGFDELHAYFRGLFRRVTPEDIDAFEQTYRGGDAEKEDLMRFYRRHRGDLSEVLSHIPCSDQHDLPRFRLFLSAQVHSKQLPSFPAFRRHRLSKKQVAEAGPEAQLPPPRADTDADDQGMQELAAQMAANAKRRAGEAAERMGRLEALVREEGGERRRAIADADHTPKRGRVSKGGKTKKGQQSVAKHRDGSERGGAGRAKTARETRRRQR